MQADRREQLLAWAGAEAGRYILEDDYDSEFRFYGKPAPALQGMGEPARVVYFYTFAKSLAPSMRISYMVLPWELMKKWQERFRGYSCSVPSFEQYTLQRFMEEGYYERHLNRMKTIYRSRRDAIMQALEYPGLRGIGMDAGLHFVLETRLGLSEAELVERAARAGVRVRGMSEYYAGGQDTAPYPRLIIGYGSYDEEALRVAAGLLLQAWKE